jgi:beta-N-acetylhexosaminidase
VIGEMPALSRRLRAYVFRWSPLSWMYFTPRRLAIDKRLFRGLVAAALLIPLTACSSSRASENHAADAPKSLAKSPKSVSTTSTTICSNEGVIATWSLMQRAEQLVVVPVEETDVQAILPSVQEGVGGIILYGSWAPTDLGTQLANVVAQAPNSIHPLVMTDEEGGDVQRMPNLVGSLPWPATMAQTMSPAQVRALAEQTASKMLANGVTVDLAPVLDLASGPGPDALHTDGPRSFSLDPTTATDYGLAFAEGLESGGVVPVVKHFPGEGSATANTDDAPASTPPIAALEQADLLPFEAAIKAGLPAIMVGNASVPGLTSMPASLSSAAIEGLLRHQLGFTGLVITDSLSAGAITALGLDIPDASVDAIEAGADMILFNSSDPNTTAQEIVTQIVNAVTAGTISFTQLDDAVAEVLAVKDIHLCA